MVCLIVGGALLADLHVSYDSRSVAGKVVAASAVATGHDRFGNDFYQVQKTIAYGTTANCSMTTAGTYGHQGDAIAAAHRVPLGGAVQVHVSRRRHGCISEHKFDRKSDTAIAIVGAGGGALLLLASCFCCMSFCFHDGSKAAAAASPLPMHDNV